MKNFENLYFEIDPKKEEILSPAKQIETNWRNISGLIYLPDEKLYDLSWAGYENCGFLKLSKDNSEKIERFQSNFDVLNFVKSLCKDLTSSNRYNKECGIINIDGKYSLQLTDRCKLLITMKYLECIYTKDLTFEWKTISGYVNFKSSDFIKLYMAIQKYVQTLYDEEKNIMEKIDSCKNISNLLNIDLDLNSSNNIAL